MRHDVFISHAKDDKLTADAVCAGLESAGIRCWVAPRDIMPGMEWGQAIINAIHETSVMVLIFSAHTNASKYVIREVERCVDAGKILVPFRVNDVLPSGSMEFFLGSQHWLDALTPPLEHHIGRLAETIKQIIGDSSQRPFAGVIDEDEAVFHRPPPIPERPQPTPPPRSQPGPQPRAEGRAEPAAQPRPEPRAQPRPEPRQPPPLPPIGVRVAPTGRRFSSKALFIAVPLVLVIAAVAYNAATSGDSHAQTSAAADTAAAPGPKVSLDKAREDLAVASVHLDRGEYAAAVAGADSVAGELKNSSGSEADVAALRQRVDSVRTAARTACAAERQVAQRRGVTGPECPN